MSSNTKWYESEVARNILEKKYYHEGEDFDGFVQRVSGIFSLGIRHEIADALEHADFFPAGRSLYGAGSKGKFKSTMSNCYILPSPEDNIESIYFRAGQAGRIFSYGGGVGINVSTLRPNGAKVNNSAKTSTGAVSFLPVFDVTGTTIGANNRRAAMMLAMNCNHPDIEEFVKAKQNTDKINSANLSVVFDDKFMDAVREDNKYKLYFKTAHEEIEKKISARNFFEDFSKSAWEWGEPGCIFIDNVRKHNLLSGYPEYKIEVSNPCAEYFGNAYNSCNLGSINLYNCVDDKFTDMARFNKTKFAKLVTLGVKALDEIIEYGYDMQPLDENRKCIDDWRAIGLGVFGLADALAALNIPYGSQKSRELCREIFYLMLWRALDTSADLAKEKGCFNKYDVDKTTDSPLLRKMPMDLLEKIEKYGLRNGSLLSIAPTGSISTMCGLSGGIEPFFRLEYDRTTHKMEESGQTFKVKVKSYDDFTKMEPKTAVTNRSFITAERIPWKDRVLLQGTIQEYIDNAISSTVNLPNNATVQDVYKAYVLAWVEGCKGLTVFRDGCSRTGILISEIKPTHSHIQFDSIGPEKRGGIKIVEGSTIVGHTACVKNLYTTVNRNEGNIFEVFTNTTSGCKSNINTITRLASLALRCGVKVEEVISELKANICPACNILQRQGNTDINNSCGSCVAEALEIVYGKKENYPTTNLKCPECGANSLRPEGKCFNCPECGYSKCE